MKQDNNFKLYQQRFITSKGLKRHLNVIKRRKRKSSNGASKNLNSDEQYKLLYTNNRVAFIDFINTNFTTSKFVKTIIYAPKELSFVNDFESTILFFDEFNKSLYESTQNTIINFKNCSYVDIASLTLIQIYKLHFAEFISSFNKKQFIKLNKNIKFNESDFLQTNKALFAAKIIEKFEKMDEILNSSFLSLGMKIGTKSRKNYKENNKGRICTEIQKFINDTIKASDIELHPRGKKYIENLMGEILGNAEDHSLLNRFFVNGISFQEKETDPTSPLIELNLAIINFGYSIFDGFKKNEHENIEIHQKMESLYSVHESQFNSKDNDHYTKESLFTLYALQEGISRLKYLDGSRGNGTMNFIKAFINLGKLGELKAEYKSKLHVISGKTIIECTNEYKPFEETTDHGSSIFKLSLNRAKDLKKLPEKNCIFAKKKAFPGTILQVKIFMTKEYFKNTLIDDNGENNN